MNVSFRRVLRSDNVEGWIVYSEVGVSHSTDIAVIIFGENTNLLYIFSDSTERLNDVDYLTFVCNLVHDLPGDFSLNKKLMSTPPADTFINELINECMTVNSDMQSKVDEF